MLYHVVLYIDVPRNCQIPNITNDNSLTTGDTQPIDSSTRLGLVRSHGLPCAKLTREFSDSWMVQFDAQQIHGFRHHMAPTNSWFCRKEFRFGTVGRYLHFLGVPWYTWLAYICPACSQLSSWCRQQSQPTRPLLQRAMVALGIAELLHAVTLWPPTMYMFFPEWKRCAVYTFRLVWG